MATVQRGVPLYSNRAASPMLFAWKEAKPYQQFHQAVMGNQGEYRGLYSACSEWLKMAVLLFLRVVGKCSYQPP
eukprot:60199-Prorocentrum_lima.AAC.1